MNKIFNNALPLIASVLGRKYNVKVEIGGESACTDGQVIRLPTIPFDMSEDDKRLVNAFLNHESAHVRESDFSILKEKQASPLLKNIWNIIEDWRIEHAFCKRFVGCRASFNWLINHIFNEPLESKQRTKALIVNYILLTVRSWDVTALGSNRVILFDAMKKKFPQLLIKINDVLLRVRDSCKSTAHAYDYAKEIADSISDEASRAEKKAQDVINDPSKSNTPKRQAKTNSNQLNKLLQMDEKDLPKGVGEAVGEILETQAKNLCDEGFVVAKVVKKPTESLEDADIALAKQASNSLHARLQGLLQSNVLVRRSGSYAGKLDMKNLHKINYESKVFMRNGQRTGVNTAIHVLLDCSGSMVNEIDLASLATFTIADSLSKINGINLAVTAFPSGSSCEHITGTVSPIITYGQKLHRDFKLKPRGSTPLSDALWWVFQENIMLTESRKIVLIITDGSPDSASNSLHAIKMGVKLGNEIYGIGIDSNAIKELLPQTSKVIKKIEELSGTMFSLLQNALTTSSKSA